MKLTGMISSTGVETGAFLSGGPLRRPRIWIMVIDEHLARIFIKNNGRPALIGEAEPTAGDLAAFASEIGDWLDNAVRQDAFDRLVLIAAPAILESLRHVLPGPVQNRIVADVRKDLSGLPPQQLETELDKIVWF